MHAHVMENVHIHYFVTEIGILKKYWGVTYTGWPIGALYSLPNFRHSRQGRFGYVFVVFAGLGVGRAWTQRHMDTDTQIAQTRRRTLNKWRHQSLFRMFRVNDGVQARCGVEKFVPSGGHARPSWSHSANDYMSIDDCHEKIRHHPPCGRIVQYGIHVMNISERFPSVNNFM